MYTKDNKEPNRGTILYANEGKVNGYIITTKDYTIKYG